MTMLCMTPVSWLSKTREKGAFATASSVVGSKPDVDAPTGAVTVSAPPAPPDAPADGDTPAGADLATLGAAADAAPGAPDDEANGMPEAAPAPMRVPDAAASVQPQ